MQKGKWSTPTATRQRVVLSCPVTAGNKLLLLLLLLRSNRRLHCLGAVTMRLRSSNEVFKVGLLQYLMPTLYLPFACVTHAKRFPKMQFDIATVPSVFEKKNTLGRFATFIDVSPMLATPHARVCVSAFSTRQKVEEKKQQERCSAPRGAEKAKAERYRGILLQKDHSLAPQPGASSIHQHCSDPR